MGHKLFFSTIAFLLIVLNGISQQTGSFTDSRDGRTYKTVKIGTQIWMAENLDYKPKSGNYYTYEIPKYGYLYDWETAKKVCPYDWHLPSESEWETLIEYIGGKNAGYKLKAKFGWEGNGNGTDLYGFKALPGGGRTKEGIHIIPSYGYFWASTISPFNENEAATYCLGDDINTIISHYDYIKEMYPVRCIKD